MERYHGSARSARQATIAEEQVRSISYRMIFEQRRHRARLGSRRRLDMEFNEAGASRHDTVSGQATSFSAEASGERLRRRQRRVWSDESPHAASPESRIRSPSAARVPAASLRSPSRNRASWPEVLREGDQAPVVKFSQLVPSDRPRTNRRGIVAEIEKQFTRLDAGIAALHRVQANLKRYRAAVLKAACEGRLVPTEAELARREGRSYETGGELLERLLSERRVTLERARQLHEEPIEPANASLAALPDGWTWGTDAQTLRAQLCNGGLYKGPIDRLEFARSGYSSRNVQLRTSTYDDVRYLGL